MRRRLSDLFARPAREVPGQYPNTINPDGHLGVQAPKVMAGVEWTGADYDQVATRPTPPRASRTWRMSSAAEVTTNTDVALTHQPGTDTAGIHRGRGEPDTRRAEADRAATPFPEYHPFPEETVNARPLVQLDPEPAPARARQGFTGEDPTRSARFPIAYTLRLFDQGIAQHPSATPKAGQANPLASRPPQRSRLIGGRPSPAGSTGSTMQPVAATPNTVRTAPGAWDARVVNPGTQAVVSHARRAAGWRAR